MAEEPDRITKIIENKEYSDAGIFRFKFWSIDNWVSVNVDDRLPVRKRRDYWRPWGTRKSQNNAWWVPLLEKAYAKLDQSYERIAGGSGHEGLRVLTGMPTIRLWQDDDLDE